jgi:parvulin-like peptidyl-prolyl isomerase
MDVTGRRSGRAVQSGEVGAVNGVPIPVQRWQQVVHQAENQLRRQAGDREVLPNQYALADEQAWQQLVRSVIVEQEVERLGLTATDDEILEVFRSNPPQEILAGYVDEEGKIDIDRYYADLNNPARDWSQEEAYIRAVLPQLKLQEIIVAPVIVSEAEVERAYRRQTGRAVAELMGVSYADLESDYEPDEAAIRTFYEENPGRFTRPRLADVVVATWPKEPSSEDLQLAENEARELREEIVGGEIDFAEAARLYSDDAGSRDQGGDLGTFDRQRMVAPFTEAAFALPVGEISEPIRTRFGYHLIEVLERVPGEDGEIAEIHARHILFKVEPGSATLGALYDAAVDFRARVDVDNFFATAEAESIQVTAPDPFAEGGDIPTVAQSARGNSWIFRSAPGDVSPVFQGRDGYYVVALRGFVPKGPAPLDDVRNQIIAELQRRHQRELARQKLAPAVGEAQLGGAITAAAEKYGLVHAVTDTFGVNENIPETGYATTFNEVALAVPVGQLVPEVETPRGLFALRVLWRSEFDEDAYLEQRDAIYENLLARKQREALETWFARKIAAAKIVDLRDEFAGGA